MIGEKVVVAACSMIPQLAVTTAVLRYMKPTQPARGIRMCNSGADTGCINKKPPPPIPANLLQIFDFLQ